MKPHRKYTVAALSIGASLAAIPALASHSTPHDLAHKPIEIVEVVERYYAPQSQNELSLSGLSQRYSERLVVERASALSEAVMLAFEAAGIELELAGEKFVKEGHDAALVSASVRQRRIQYSALQAPIAGLRPLTGQALTF